MNMLRHTLIVFAAVMLASCGIYTNYERPAQAVADMDSLYPRRTRTTSRCSPPGNPCSRHSWQLLRIVMMKYRA